MRGLVTSLASVAVALAVAGPVRAAESVDLPKHDWSFSGIFGTFDRAALQRGFQVYKDVCSGCHAMHLMAYRNLAEIGFNADQIKAIASSVTVVDAEPDENGDPVERPGRASDHFVSPFPNDQAARAANNGALPPDLSLIIRAREGGPDYVYDILTGFTDPPPDFKLQDGMNYNTAFPGHQIAMPPPLSEDAVEYADGTKATVPQMAEDVVTFLRWTSNPELEERKRIGLKVILYLLVLAGMLYAVKRRIWSKVH